MTQIESTREQMIEHQARAWEVLDERILAALRAVRREDFVPAGQEYQAFADTEVPLPHGQQMLRPGLAGRLLQALGLKGTERVLEIGAGSGFVTACLAKNAASVKSVELYEDLANTAAANLQRAGIRNAEVVVADAASDQAHSEGGALSGRFDAILFTCALPVYDDRFEQLLTDGGRLVVAVGENTMQELLLITRRGGSEWVRDSLFEVALDPLINARRPERFSF